MSAPPAASRYAFDAALAQTLPGEDLVAVGGDLRPGTLLDAYANGLFPMGLGDGGADPLGWWSPDPRGVMPLTGMHVSRSLRAARKRFEISFDTAFDEVVLGCADPGRTGAWITPAISRAYSRLHELGHAHSVECRQDGDLVGGVYGVSIGGLFAGESMFHRRRDASKVALLALVEFLASDGDQHRLFDVQWSTDHLSGLGVVEVPRKEYLRRLDRALSRPGPKWDDAAATCRATPPR